MVGVIFRRVSNSGQVRGFRFTPVGSVIRRSNQLPEGLRICPTNSPV
ncbi:hypothetical protein HanRHA438_Chr10g0472691 [Helianthus annuus]|uniref:Uncharacterized protein n=1 Tax=Helianthus annuus TaxID=4232 RepID=A0A9K3I175_HELAN|nr:hypothetical protein HanXRQr2_Chr10g0460051 [Helianthus annuus]KAJ0881286.1 hypothetical protein HanRHA438_Chr10g0472691 [Helianthus annuus]KAJ0885336.1 hypothetical protein HanPSC8_Chr10g0444141 [Helianthus annuus]